MVDARSAAVTLERGRLHARQSRLAAGAGIGVALWTVAIVAGSSAVPIASLAIWLGFSAALLAVRLLSTQALSSAGAAHVARVEALHELAAALGGLIAGAAGTLFLPLLEPPARLAITVAACAGLAAAIVDIGHQGRPFRLQTACCMGQFALAWWRLDEAGAGVVAASLAGFGLLAAFASTHIDRLGRQMLAGSLENRRLAESLAIEHGRAVAADRAKTHFIAAASHDLRQPAAALSLMTHLLRQQATDPALAPTVTGLERSVNAMNDLLGQLLDLSRLDTGRITVETRAVDIDALLDDLAHEVAPQAAERGLSVHVEHCARQLDCDPVLLARMLRNLIDNALRHTLRGGITLGARICVAPDEPSRDLLCLSVADTGGGIAAEHHAHIFDEHYQVGDESRLQASGLGLGLAIVRRIAALHDVAIDIESVPDKGSRFTLRFRSSAHRPISKPVRLAPSGTALPPTPRFAGRRLLLIEDDEILGRAFLAWFQAAGFDACRAADGAEGERMLSAIAALDVVVSDFRLPGSLDGLGLLRLAAERHPGAYRILVTGDIDPWLSEQAAAHGIPLLRKPIDPSVLHGVLTAGLNGA